MKSSLALEAYIWPTQLPVRQSELLRVTFPWGSGNVKSPPGPLPGEKPKRGISISEESFMVGCRRSLIGQWQRLELYGYLPRKYVFFHLLPPKEVDICFYSLLNSLLSSVSINLPSPFGTSLPHCPPGFSVQPGERWVLETGRDYEVTVEIYDWDSNRAFPADVSHTWPRVTLWVKLPQTSSHRTTNWVVRVHGPIQFTILVECYWVAPYSFAR